LAEQPSRLIRRSYVRIRKQIKNKKYDLIINVYPQHSIDSIIKPRISNRPSLGRTYYETVINPYVRGISKNFRHFGKRFNCRKILQNKHTLRGTPMKAAPVRDAKQTEQCVCDIPCGCGRCYIAKQISQVSIKESRCNLTQ
jgi:hypothetical protein